MPLVRDPITRTLRPETLPDLLTPQVDRLSATPVVVVDDLPGADRPPGEVIVVRRSDLTVWELLTNGNRRWRQWQPGVGTRVRKSLNVL